MGKIFTNYILDLYSEHTKNSYNNNNSKQF